MDSRLPMPFRLAQEHLVAPQSAETELSRSRACISLLSPAEVQAVNGHGHGAVDP